MGNTLHLNHTAGNCDEIVFSDGAVFKRCEQSDEIERAGIAEQERFCEITKMFSKGKAESMSDINRLHEIVESMLEEYDYDEEAALAAFKDYLESLSIARDEHWFDKKEFPNMSFVDALASKFDKYELDALCDELQYLIDRKGAIRPMLDMSPGLDGVRQSAKCWYDMKFKTKADYRVLLDDMEEALSRIIEREV